MVTAPDFDSGSVGSIPTGAANGFCQLYQKRTDVLMATVCLKGVHALKYRDFLVEDFSISKNLGHRMDWLRRDL